MTKKRILETVTMYRQRLESAGIPKERADTTKTFKDLSESQVLAHAHFLCDGVPQYANMKGKMGKINRHLTAIQMCLSFAGWYTLEDLLEHNRPPERKKQKH